MAFAPRKLFDGTLLTTSEQTLYTSSASPKKRTKITKLVACNATGNSATITVYRIDAGASSSDRYKVFNEVLLEANETIDLIEGRLILEPGDSLTALASSSNDIAIHGDGNVVSID